MIATAAGIGAFLIIAFVALVPPLMWHIKCKNIPAVILISWLMYVNLTGFINTMIWSGANFDFSWDGMVWCDIIIKLDAGAAVGKCSAIACLAMNLYMVLEAKHPLFLDQKSWKKKAIDLSICLITPIFVMAVQYVIQAARYDIYKYQGCTSVFSASYASIGLYAIWPVIWSGIAFIFACLTVFVFFRRRKDVKDILVVTNSGLNMRKFARLLIFSFLIIFAMLPLSLYYCISQAVVSQQTFNWDETHDDHWGDIYFVDAGYAFIYDRLVNAVLSILTFFIFGLGSDAIHMYKTLLSRIGFKFGKKVNDGTQPMSQVDTYVSSMQPQAKINTNKSQFSNTTSFTNASTMRDLENQFGDVLHEIIAEDTKAFRFDGGRVSGAATPVKENDIEVQLREILETTDSPSEHFSYKYEVQQKPQN
ncbi:Pheromone a factor receptor [Candida viswanathii]|uniref:Pheromone a factor receptor n=1 Tax=Candida viswanathii TaxID=5486 RepID=A0A367XTM1_9ASCO|nr:Pheromone a factor receptor [Candida viswanathii]